MPKGIYIRLKPVWNKGLSEEEYRDHYPNGFKGTKKGAKFSKERRLKMSENNACYWKGKKLTKESLIKRTNKRKKYGWYKNPKEMSEKLRKAKLNYIFKNGAGPTIGKNEKEILDKLEKLYKYKIIRQYLICGYSVDGYIPEINLCIEVDESYHKKIIKKDIIRQKNIEKELKCKFLRIKDKTAEKVISIL